MIFACDGTYSVVKNEFLKTPEFSYQITYSGYGYCELSIPSKDIADRKSENDLFRLDDSVFYHWPR